MKFPIVSKEAAAFAETHLRMMPLMCRHFNHQAIRVPSASMNMTQRRKLFQMSLSGYGYNMKSFTSNYFENNSTFRPTTKRWITGTLFSPTQILLEKIVVKVPTMGDSITEGTIVEWTATVGQAVKTDDVIALIETDKVTIDIKADMDGVITQHFGSVDETVEVGAKLYELDTDAVASVSAPAVRAQASASSTPSKPAPTPSNDSPSKTTIPASDHRSPSIKFLGKDGWEALRKGHDTKKQVQSSDSITSTKKHAVTTIIDNKNVKDPMYGRPKFTESEMEALLTGGATLAPQVLSLSTGAKFKL